MFLHPGLNTLLKLRFIAGTRRILRQLGTIRGAGYLALMGIAAAALVLSKSSPALLLMTSLGLDPTASYGSRATIWLPVSLLLLCFYGLLSTHERPVYFNAAERSQLLAAPIPHQQLVLFKLIQFAAGAMITAGALSVLASGTNGFLRTSTSLFSLLVFAQSLIVCFSLLDQQAQVSQSRKRNTRLGLAACLALIALVVTLRFQHHSGSIEQFIANDNLLEMLFLPFRPFSELFGSNPSHHYFFWLTVAWTINTILIYCTMRYTNPQEASSVGAASARQLSKHQWPALLKTVRGRRPKQTSDFKATVFVFAWRQWRAVATHAPQRLLVLAILVMLSGPLLITGEQGAAALTRYGLIFAIAIFVIPRALAYDFRNDRTQLAYLRTLPVSPTAIAVGQVFMPTLIATLLIWGQLGTAYIGVPYTQRQGLITGAMFVPLMNFIIYSSDNLFFLLFPKGYKPNGRMDFDFMGRMLTELLLRIVLASLITGSAIFVALAGNPFFGPSANTFFVLCWGTALALCLPLAYLTGKAFKYSQH